MQVEVENYRFARSPTLPYRFLPLYANKTRGTHSQVGKGGSPPLSSSESNRPRCKKERPQEQIEKVVSDRRSRYACARHLIDGHDDC